MNLFLFLILGTALPSSPVEDYDPLPVTGKVSTQDVQFTYGDDERVVPLRIYLPESESKAPVILFSHGLGGSKNNNPYLGKQWAGRGYVVVFMQHAGSDEAIWKNTARRNRMREMKRAASLRSFVDRTKDVPATLDQLEKWNRPEGKLEGRLDLSKIGMSGHSFGALTTQAVGGQNYGRLGPVYCDKRIKAALAMSPNVPQNGNTKNTFAKVRIPWLLMTGTKDKSLIGRGSAEDRRKVFQQLPTNGKSYELVLNEAEHMAFSERRLLGGRQRNPNHHRAILAISTAFWDCYLRGDKGAKAWLQGTGPRSVLEPKDLWSTK